MRNSSVALRGSVNLDYVGAKTIAIHAHSNIGSIDNLMSDPIACVLYV